VIFVSLGFPLLPFRFVGFFFFFFFLEEVGMFMNTAILNSQIRQCNSYASNIVPPSTQSTSLLSKAVAVRLGLTSLPP